MPTATRPNISTGSYAWNAELSKGWLSRDGGTGPGGGANGSTDLQAITDGTIAATEASLTQARERRLAEVRVRSSRE